MAEEGLARAVALVAHNASASGSILPALCAAGMSMLPVAGVGISLMIDGQYQGALCTSDQVVRMIEELQFTVGEGPGIEASRRGAPVLEPDLARAGARWPAFVEAAMKAGVAGAFSIPLQVGVICLGVLDLYRDRPGELSLNELADGLVLADIAVRTVLILQAEWPPEAMHADLEAVIGRMSQDHQATGMISVQLEISMRIRLQKYAYAEGTPIGAVARAVVTRQLRFDQLL
jgi:hypothetical protein